MSYLDKVKPISESGRRKLVVLWGKSNTGKTEFGSTWPKPMLYIQMGDDGSNTIAQKDGIKYFYAETLENVKGILQELIAAKGSKYKTVFLDTFSMYVNMWVDEKVVQRNKKMTQQLWGELKTDTEDIIRLAHKLSLHTWVLLSCHEAMDSFDGMEDEILPDARPNLSKGVRTYLEGMANYGFHTTRLKRDIIDSEGKEKTEVKYATHIGPNPYYWTKMQVPKEVKVPAIMLNPTFAKLQKKGLIT